MRTVNAALLDCAGLTVVEVVIALGVTMVGLLALVAAAPLGTSLIGGSNRTTTATFLAQQRLEQIKSARWTVTGGVDTLGGAGSSGMAAVPQWADEGYGDNPTYPHFRREVRIRDCSVSPCSGIPAGTGGANTLRQVTVTVFFQSLTGVGTASSDEQRVQLVTLIARR
jgi:hypothetical protein